MRLEPLDSPVARGESKDETHAVAAAPLLPAPGPGWRPFAGPDKPRLCCSRGPGPIARAGTASLPTTRTGTLVYKYAPSQALTFPVRPGISVAMGQEPIWLNAAIDGGQNCLHAGRGDGRAGAGSVPTCLGPRRAPWPFRLLEARGAGSRTWELSKACCPLHCTDSINTPYLS